MPCTRCRPNRTRSQRRRPPSRGGASSCRTSPWARPGMNRWPSRTLGGIPSERAACERRGASEQKETQTRPHANSRQLRGVLSH
eukprot:9111270-Alexandrium_andersonii.AAC.1